MFWQHTPITAPLILSSLVMIALALAVVRKRRTPDGKSAALLMLAVAVWSLTYALELGSGTLANKVFWAKVQYFGIVGAPLAWFCFAVQYTQREHWLKARNLALLAIEPLIIILLVWTNDTHRLLWSDWNIKTGSSLSILVLSHGPAFWMHFIYAYLLMLSGTILIIRTLVRSHRIYRSQSIAMLIAALGPWTGNALYIADLDIFYNLDLTVFGFVISCLASGWGMLRYQMLDIVPVARDAVIENMDDVVIVLDSQDRIIDLNAAAVGILDSISSDPIGKPIENAIPHWGDLVESYYNFKTKNSEVVFWEDTEHRREFDLHISSLNGRVQEEEGQLVVMRDITEQKQLERELVKYSHQLEEQVQERTNEIAEANELLRQEIDERRIIEKKLRESERRHRNTLDAIPDIVYEVTPDGKFLYSNRAVSEVLGYSEEDLHKAGLLKFLDEKGLVKAQRVARDLMKGKKPPPTLYKIKAADGRIVPIESRATLIEREGLEPTFVGVNRDITDQLKAEEALRESEEKYRLLVENAIDAIFIIQGEKIIFSSSMAEEMTGYTAEELSSTPYTKLIHVDDQPTAFERYKKILNGEALSSSHAYRMLRKDGEEFWGRTNTVLMKWKEKPAVLCFVRDITEQRKLEAQLQQAQKMESIGTLAGGIAHDFNNLLGGILGYASLTKTKISEDNPIYDYIDTIEKGATRAAELTSQLLAFARGGRYETRAVNLNSVVEETLEFLGRTFEKSIEIETHFHSSMPTVEADSGQIQQVLMNLCLNARDAMDGGGRLIIETKSEKLTDEYLKTHIEAKPGSYVTISVSDTGVGINKDIVGNIFEPFFTTKKDGKGTGLGLAMVYGVVKNHGGFVTVYSELCVGTTFKVYLPVSGKPEEEQLEEIEVETGCNELILVVDDEEFIRSLTQEILESNGYKVLLAENGSEAVETFERLKDKISLVILDMVMPKMGGRETYLKLRQIKPEVKALLSTGYSQDGKARAILDSGVKGFIQKPYQVNSLLSKIRSVLDTN